MSVPDGTHAPPIEPAGTEPSSAGPSVLDASAVLAWLQGESGSDVAQAYLEDAAICAVNFAEIHQKLAQHGIDADRTTRLLRTAGISVEPFDVTDAIAASRLWPATRAAGLSLGDRCCLALAARLRRPAVTADAAWTRLDLGVKIVAIR